MLKVTRLFISCRRRTFSSCSTQEIKIPVLFGHMTAKVSGPVDGQPVLALHGWQENAGTFDPLVPYLDPSLRVVALDLPGHGLSSHLPPGCVYHYLDNLLYIKTAVDYLRWTRFSLLGHSMGGGLSLMFAGLFPHFVESVVSLDVVKPISTPQGDLIVQSRKGIEKSVDTFGKLERAAPVYSAEEIAKRLVKVSLGSLTTSSANVILKRGSAPFENGGGLVLTRDLRLNNILHPDDETCKTYLGGIKCNLLVIKSTEGYPYESDETLILYQTMYSRNCASFFFKELVGNHHLHMDDPQAVANLVNLFFLKKYHELNSL